MLLLFENLRKVIDMKVILKINGNLYYKKVTKIYERKHIFNIK
jgi:hypothetical protein